MIPVDQALAAGSGGSGLAAHASRLFGNRPAVDGTLVRENFARWFDGSSVIEADGAPQVVYHGTRAGSFGCFKPHIRAGEQLGFGVHFSLSRSFAERYASDTGESVVGRRGNQPKLYQVYLQMARPLVAGQVACEGSPEFDLARQLARRSLVTIKDAGGRPSCWMQNAIDSSGPDRAQRLIQDAGYDGVVYEAKLGSILQMPSASYRTVSQASRAFIVFRPEQIKAIDNPSGLYDRLSPDMCDVISLDAVDGPAYDDSDPGERGMTLPWESMPPAWRGAPTTFCADGDGMWRVEHLPVPGFEEDWSVTSDVRSEPAMVPRAAGWYVKSQNVVVARAAANRESEDVLLQAERLMRRFEPDMYDHLSIRPTHRASERQA